MKEDEVFAIRYKLHTQKRRLEDMGYKVAYIALYGSQNYDLHINTKEYKSDVDMKAIIVPNLDNLIENSKPVSLVVDTQWGQCDVKDIRVFFDTLIKANPAYIETLFTNFYIVDANFEKEFNEIHGLKHHLLFSLRFQFIRAIYDMMCEKEKALCHPYPSIVDKIEKYGYDGKQAHHVKRLQLLMFDYFYFDLNLDQCLIPDNKELINLFEFKLNKLSLQDAKIQVANIMQIAKEFKDEYLEKETDYVVDNSIKERYIELSRQIIKNKIEQEIISIGRS